MLKSMAFRRVLIHPPCHRRFAHSTLGKRQHSGKHPSFLATVHGHTDQHIALGNQQQHERTRRKAR